MSVVIQPRWVLVIKKEALCLNLMLAEQIGGSHLKKHQDDLMYKKEKSKTWY